jgi:chitinase
VVLAATAVAGGFVALRFKADRSISSAPRWFAPYVDVTETPKYDFQDPQTNSSSDVILAFVVAAKAASCEPSWGTSYSLQQADEQLDLERRVVRQRQRGGDVIVSFGGALNDELAIVCTDQVALSAAYSAVVEHLNLTTVDFDLEGSTLSNTAANVRRAKALASVQKARRDAGSDLAVWLTLPVSPDGLDSAAVATIDDMIGGGVDLAGVNILTMDYGTSRRSSVSLVDASIQAAEATFTVLSNSYRRAGVSLTSDQVWQRIGITPMIGQNDTIADRLDIDGARKLHRDAAAHGIGRMSMWSANRDNPCGGNLLATVVNNNCSGVEQESGQFAKVLSAG